MYSCKIYTQSIRDLDKCNLTGVVWFKAQNQFKVMTKLPQACANPRYAMYLLLRQLELFTSERGDARLDSSGTDGNQKESNEREGTGREKFEL